MNSRDFFRLSVLFAVITALLGPVLFTHQIYFSEDLTYINHPWRVLVAESLQRGEMPLWNPYVMFGMPLLGNFQTGIFYPLSLIYDFLPFASANGFYLLTVFFLAAGGAYLWLKRWGLRGNACLIGASIFSIGGYMVGDLQFPNTMGTIALWPVLFLFSDRPVLLALTAAVAFLSGHPPNWIGITASFFLLRWALSTRPIKPMVKSYLRMTAAVAGCILLAALVIGPGMQLILKSARGEEGLRMIERIDASLEPYELTTLVHPALARWWSHPVQPGHQQKVVITWNYQGTVRKFHFDNDQWDPLYDPSGLKGLSYKSGYIGLAASVLVLMGLVLWARKSMIKTAALLGYSLAVAILLLGNQTAVSEWLWQNLYPLQFLRGPGRLDYLWLGVAVPLAAVGAARLGKYAGLAAIIVLVELAGLGWRFNPTLPADYYRDSGELVEFLRSNLGADRYFRRQAGELLWHLNEKDDSPDYAKFKEVVLRADHQKLFGISNAPFHLAQGSGGYEPLVPTGAKRISEYFERSPIRDVAARMQWAGIKFLLNDKPVQADNLIDRGVHLWHVYETKNPVSRAYWLQGDFGKDLEMHFMEIPGKLAANPLNYSRGGDDRFSVTGDAPGNGWLYVAEPFYPGWEVYVDGKRAPMERALDAFIKVKVPAGAIDARFVYRPGSWILGLWISLLSVVGLAWLGAKKAVNFA